MVTSYAYQKRWRHERAQGLTRTVPADQCRLHIAALQGAGWSLRAIAGAADVAAGTVSLIARGEQATVTKPVAARLLAVSAKRVPSTPSKQVTEPFVPRTGTTRRVQALLYMGWGHRQMRDHCGLNTANLVAQQGRWVTRTTHDAVASMYRELSHRPGPSSKARLYASRLGYQGPAAWDDIDLDAEPEYDELGTAL